MSIPGIWLALPCALMEGRPACSGVDITPACRCSGSSGLVDAWWFGSGWCGMNGGYWEMVVKGWLLGKFVDCT